MHGGGKSNVHYSCERNCCRRGNNRVLLQKLCSTGGTRRHFIHLGFHCKCKRCVLEGFLGPSFEQLSHIIHNFYNSLFDQAEPTNVSSRDMQSMVGFAVQLENIDAQSEEKHLIRASFSCIYKYVYAAAMEYPDFSVLLRLLPTKLEVAESLRHADPSSPISLELFQMLVEEVHGQERDLLLQKTMENGIVVFGKQKEDVLKALVESRFVMRFQTVRTWNPDEIFVSITF
ncbi:hypothetical protein SUGI_1092850 [Cryptomeria japonica]|nr:hypothetical protein SUGI_1092850 [Cryptomeria japonica]